MEQDTNTNNADRLKSTTTTDSATIPSKIESPKVIDSQIEEKCIEAVESQDQTANDEEVKAKYSAATKKIYVLILALAGFLGPLSSSIHVPALKSMAEDLQTTDETANLSVSTFLISMALGPMIWASMADRYGRRPIIFWSLLIYTIGSIGCVLSKSISLLIVMRLLQGFGSSATGAVGIGVISDIFNKDEIGGAVGWFNIGPYAGPVIGPTIGGLITEFAGWRNIFWLLTALGGFFTIIIFVLLKETLPDSKKQPYPISYDKTSKKWTFKNTLPNPFSPLLFLRHFDVLLLSLWGCVIFGAYYAIVVSQPHTVGESYQLTSSQVGLSFLPIGLGNLVGSSCLGHVSDIVYKRVAKKYNGNQPPINTRLLISWIGATVSIVALLIIGWLTHYRLALPVIFIAQFFIGISMISVFLGMSNYFIELFKFRSSSVSACGSFIRVIFASIVTSVILPLIQALGIGWTFTIFALLQLLGVFTLVFLTVKGDNIKKKYESYNY